MQPDADTGHFGFMWSTQNKVNLPASHGNFDQERMGMLLASRGCWAERTAQHLAGSWKLCNRPSMVFTECSFIVLSHVVFPKISIDLSPTLDPLASVSKDLKCFSHGFSLLGVAESCCITCSPGCFLQRTPQAPVRSLGLPQDLAEKSVTV